MNLNKWYVTGDCHRDFSRFSLLNLQEPCNIIILGDFSINYFLNKSDQKKKEELVNNFPLFTFYCVRGNHDARPQDLPHITVKYDEEITGMIYYEPEFPNIRYLLDGGEYNIDGYTTLVIGGAYSVDKWYRISRKGYTEENNNPKVTGWFNDEMLTMAEMAEIADRVQGKHFDLILAHTCPISIEPTDLFLPMIDQSKVDKSMERFLEKISNITSYNVWLFGHFHRDRLERPHIEQFYTDIEELDSIMQRWEKYDKTGELDWGLDKSPNFLRKEFINNEE